MNSSTYDCWFMDESVDSGSKSVLDIVWPCQRQEMLFPSESGDAGGKTLKWLVQKALLFIFG